MINSNHRILSIVLWLAIFGIITAMISNLHLHISRQNLEFGFDFLLQRSGFDIGDTWITHQANMPYWNAILSGLVNTIIVAAFGIVIATLLGLVLAIMAKAPYVIIKSVSDVYINIFRNIPLLVQILFFHTLLINTLPEVNNAYTIGASYVTNRGIYLPTTSPWVLIPIITLPYFFITRRIKTGVFLSVISIGILYFSQWEHPVLNRFNLSGGGSFSIEWLALVIALSLYTASYIAEVMRGGFEAISYHQYETARALNISYIKMMRHVILPQAKPIFLPALLNQYLNLTKNASLGIAIGYPDFFGVTAGTILNQSGRALEMIFIVMVVYSLGNYFSITMISKISHPQWKRHV